MHWNRVQRHGDPLATKQPRHGEHDSAEYQTWEAIKQRCGNPNNKYHAARGIKVCECWQRFESFLADMGRKPTPQHTIDRINNDGNYEPSNCRWATRLEQQNNVRRNRFVDVRGERMTISQAARVLGITYNAAYGRVMNGTPLER
jgi:hypothetical protein